MSGGAIWWQARRAMDAQPETRDRLAALLNTPCFYACQPFALPEKAGRRWLLVTVDACPSTDLAKLMAWRPGDVAAIDTTSGRAHLVGEPGGHLLGDLSGDDIHVFTCGLFWARAWAAARAEALALFRRAAVPGLPFRDPPAQGLPGLLVAGRPARVMSWAGLWGRKHVTFDNTEAAEAARRWLVRAAGVPEIEIRRERLKAAA